MDRNKSIKWHKYFMICLLLFGEFLLEMAEILGFEAGVLGFDLSHYGARQQSIHHIIIVVLWSIMTGCILVYSRKQYHFPVKKRLEKVSVRNGVIAAMCLLCCKIITFIDWHSFKIVGEFKGKSGILFFTQYLYYLFEIGLVLLIIMYGQKAMEAFRGKETSIPYGGIILSLTWGAMHFVSRGVGLELWNGISCMIFSIFAGMIYLKLNRKPWISYLCLAIGYLL